MVTATEKPPPSSCGQDVAGGCIQKYIREVILFVPCIGEKVLHPPSWEMTPAATATCGGNFCSTQQVPAQHFG